MLLLFRLNILRLCEFVWFVNVARKKNGSLRDETTCSNPGGPLALCLSVSQKLPAAVCFFCCLSAHRSWGRFPAWGRFSAPCGGRWRARSAALIFAFFISFVDLCVGGNVAKKRKHFTNQSDHCNDFLSCYELAKLLTVSRAYNWVSRVSKKST